MNRARATHRTVADHGLVLELQADAGVPDWIMILPPSPIATRDGRGPYTVADVQALILTSMEAGKLAIDVNHAIDIAGASGQPSPAVGWIVDLEARGGAIWARVEWTPTGRGLVEERAYRGISPVFVASKKGEIGALLRASFTNTPNLRGLEAALHHQETGMEELLGQLASALGLAAGADQAAIVARATELGNRTEAELQSALQPIAAALGADVEVSGRAILAAIGDRLDPAKVVSAVVVAELQSQVATLTSAIATGKAEAVVDAAIAAGKPGVKPLRDHYIARHMADPAAVERELAALPAIAGRTVIPAIDPARRGTAEGLDEVQRQAADLIGVSREAYARMLAAEAATKEGAV